MNHENLSSHASALSREDLLRKIFAFTRSVTNPHVQPDFRLVNPSSAAGTPMEEFVSDTSATRYIAMSSDSEVAKRHTELMELRLPVLSGMYTSEQLLMLNVPAGSRPIAGYVHGIRRNPDSYGPIFEEMGAIIGGLTTKLGKTLTPSAEYPLLRQFAASASNETSSGGKVYLLPPYNLADTSRTDLLRTLHQELLDSRVILTNQADYLVGRVDHGWTE